MQFLFEIQIYNKNNNTWQTLPVSHPISTLDQYQPSRADIGVSGDMGCETNFATYYSLFINSF